LTAPASEETSESAQPPSDVAKPAADNASAPAAEEKKGEEKSSEDHLPEELRTPQGASEEEKVRIKGYQANYTKYLQGLESKLRSEYDAKFQEVLRGIGRNQPLDQQQPQAQPPKGESLLDFFPTANKEEIAPLDAAIKAVIDRKLEPLKKENEALKSFVNQTQSSLKIRSEFDSAAQTFPELKERVNDLVNWAKVNPEQARGKSVSEMYQLMTWKEMYDKGRLSAKAEYEKKAKESLETDSVPNTVSNPEVKSVKDAARAAELYLRAKYNNSKKG